MTKTPALLFLAMGACAQTSLEVSKGLRDMVSSYLTGIARTQWEARAALAARIRTPAEVAARQVYIRAKMMQEIGGFPERTPLHARITGTLEGDGYRVEKLIFESQPHRYVTANVYVPAGGSAPYAAVLGTAGHSDYGKAFEPYERAWIALARRGFVVLAYDPPGQGERLEYFDAATGKPLVSGTAEHTMAGIQCLLTGTSIARYFVWDGIRAFDYLVTRADVDPKRIAVAGVSGGGTQSSYLAVFEPRLAAAAPACYLTSWEKLWLALGPQDAEQNLPNFLADGLDFPDFLIAFAPKPILMATATKDFFPIEGSKATFAEALRIFGLLSVADHVGFFEFDDTHGWSKPRREATYRWFTRWLQGREDDGVESDVTPDAPKDLRSTETGQVVTSFRDAATVQSLNAALAAEIYAKRAGAGGRNIAALVRARLGVSGARGVPPAEERGRVSRQGYWIDKIELRPEPGITVPALAFVPAGGPALKPAVLYVDAAGKGGDAGEGGPIETQVRAGNIVLALDPRGYGESAPPGDSSGAYDMLMRAMLVGKTLAGMQTGDILRAFDYLAFRHDVDGRRISIYGKGNGGVLALYAAALEPRIAKVSCDPMPTSYMDMVKMKMHRGITDIVVPGVLKDFDLPDLRKALGSRFQAVVAAR